MISIIIADDHPIFRQGLKRLLADDGRFALTGEAGTGVEALELIDRLQPDVAVLDLVMPWPDGIEIIERLAAVGARTKCVLLTMKEEAATVQRAIAAGARGYLLKESAYEELSAAIVKVAAGDLYFGVLQADAEPTAIAAAALTPREQAILRLVARGLTSRQIADLLCISHRTVEVHRRNIMEKLEIRTATGLAAYAAAHGLD